MSEDNLYIERFLNGDKEAFDMLVRKYQDRVLNVVCSIIGRDRESEDITQEVFLKVYHGLRSFRRGSLFSTWLYRVTVNTVYDFLRRRKRTAGNEGIAGPDAVSPGDPKDDLLRKERDEMVKSAIGKVPVKYRMAMVLKDIEGLSYREIAKVLRCSIGTVESRIYRARQCLKEELSGLEGGAA